MLTDLYLFNFFSHLSTIVELACFITLATVIVSFFGYCITKSGNNDSEAKAFFKVFKITLIACTVSLLLFLLVPNEKVLALMMIAPYIEDNRQTIQALPKELGDFLLEVVKQWGQK